MPGEDWTQFMAPLMRDEGVIDPGHQPSDEGIRRFDKPRKCQRVQRVAVRDPESRVAKLTAGRTHLAYQAERVVD